MQYSFRYRGEQPDDAAGIRAIHQCAFARDGEADLVDKLRASGAKTLSLVAFDLSELAVGHALFTPVTIEGGGREVHGMGLGPVAVLPEFQRRGVGTALIDSGLKTLEKARCPFVVVLGHPTYYPRFGFVPAKSRYGVTCKWDVPDDVFMIRVFDETALAGVNGVAKYAAEFDAV